MSEEAIAIFEAFHRGGKGFTWKEWQELSSEDQAALIEAGNKVARQQAALIAYFLANPIDAIMELNGEDAAVRAALTRPR